MANSQLLFWLIVWTITFTLVNSYTVVDNDGSTWSDALKSCPKKTKMAGIRNPKQYREIVRFLETEDKKIGYYIGVEWKNKRMQDMKGNIINIKHMPLLKKAVPLSINKGKEYGIYWQNGKFHNIKKNSKKKRFQIVVQRKNSYKKLAKYEYFLWGFFEQTKDKELLSLETKKIFRYKTFNGARYVPKLNQFQFKGHKWVIEMDTPEMDKLKNSIKLHGGNAEALYVQDAYLTSLTRTNIIKKVAILIRAVDKSKSILYVNNGKMKHMVYNIFKPISHMSLHDALGFCQHEYVLNLVESQVQAVKKKKMTNIDKKLLNHKGLVIIQGIPSFRIYFDDPKYFVIHVRNADRTVQKQNKDLAFHLKLDEIPHQAHHKIVTPLDLMLSDEDTSTPILWEMVDYDVKNEGTLNEYGLAHINDKQRNNDLFVFASVHNLPASAQMIKAKMEEEKPDYVFIEIDVERMAETSKEQEESDFGVTFDYAVSDDSNVDNIILADYPYREYTPWMLLREMLVSDHKLLPSITIAGIYFDVFVNMRNHMMIKTIDNFIQLNEISESKLWITVGKIHWAKGKDADAIYLKDMKDLMTDEKIYQNLEQPIKYVGNDEITLEFEIYPYKKLKKEKSKGYKKGKATMFDGLSIDNRYDLLVNLEVLASVILIGGFIAVLFCFIGGLMCGFYFHRKK